jgi:glutamyl/glutaminyl-tRNA synthetase
VPKSERVPLYKEAIARLDSEGHLYPCYCTWTEIRASTSAPHGLPAHVPLVLGSDGRDPAKRHGAATLAERSVLGERPGEILGWMARSLGLARSGRHQPPPTC